MITDEGLLDPKMLQQHPGMPCPRRRPGRLTSEFPDARKVTSPKLPIGVATTYSISDHRIKNELLRYRTRVHALIYVIRSGPSATNPESWRI